MKKFLAFVAILSVLGINAQSVADYNNRGVRKAKGGDYKGKNVVGQDIAKELKIVKFTNNKSTTKIIEKIQKL